MPEETFEERTARQAKENKPINDAIRGARSASTETAPRQQSEGSKFLRGLADRARQGKTFRPAEPEGGNGS